MSLENFNNKRIQEDKEPLKGDNFLIGEIERKKREKPTDVDPRYSEEIVQRDEDLYDESIKRDPKADKKGNPMKPYVDVDQIVDPDTEDDFEKEEDGEEENEGYSKIENFRRAKMAQKLEEQEFGFHQEAGVASVGPDVVKTLIKKNIVSETPKKKVLIKKKKLVKRNQSASNSSPKKVVIKREFQD